MTRKPPLAWAYAGDVAAVRAPAWRPAHRRTHATAHLVPAYTLTHNAVAHHDISHRIAHQHARRAAVHCRGGGGGLHVLALRLTDTHHRQCM